MDDEQLMQYRLKILKTMNQTRCQKYASSFGIEIFCPFLDPRVIKFALTLSKADLVGERTPVPLGSTYGKLILRQAFPEAYSQWRQKEPIEVGAGTTQLRMGYFESYITNEDFLEFQHKFFVQYDVVIRDKEHCYFFQKFLEAFNGDLTQVPVQRYGDDTCPACHFKIPIKEQDYCVTCGFWPARITESNKSKSEPILEALAVQIKTILTSKR